MLILIQLSTTHLDNCDSSLNLAQVVVNGSYRLPGHAPLPLIHGIRVQPAQGAQTSFTVQSGGRVRQLLEKKVSLSPACHLLHLLLTLCLFLIRQ
jgi:hypothetical protein